MSSIKLSSSKESDSKSKINFNVDLFVRRGKKKISFIKGLRSAYGVGLKEGKELAEEMIDIAERNFNSIGKTVTPFFIDKHVSASNADFEAAVQHLADCGLAIMDINNVFIRSSHSDLEDDENIVESAIVSATSLALKNGRYEVAAKLNHILICDFSHED